MKTPIRALALLAAAASVALGTTACGGGYIHFNQVPDAEEEAHTAARFGNGPAPSPASPAATAAQAVEQARAVLAQIPGDQSSNPGASADPALHDPAVWPALGHEKLGEFVARTVTRAAAEGNAISRTVRDAAQRVLAGC